MLVWVLVALIGCGAPVQGGGGAVVGDAEASFGDCDDGCDVLAPGGEVIEDGESDATGPDVLTPGGEVVDDTGSDGTGPGTGPGGDALAQSTLQPGWWLGKVALRAYLDSGDTAQDGTVCYGCDAWAYRDWTRNTLIAAGWDDRPAWDTDADPKSPPQNLVDTTPVAQVPSIAWSAQPPVGSGWKGYLATQKNLLSLVGHGQKHNEAAWKARVGAALRFLLPGPALPRGGSGALLIALRRGDPVVVAPATPKR
ncbi:MAG: hypothetical protein H6747_14785 [Deltaproteobacteria bacterium]|nr:hypothetical protein [Deltaproteobacteria bacterium]